MLCTLLSHSLRSVSVAKWLKTFITVSSLGLPSDLPYESFIKRICVTQIIVGTRAINWCMRFRITFAIFRLFSSCFAVSMLPCWFDVYIIHSHAMNSDSFRSYVADALSSLAFQLSISSALAPRPVLSWFSGRGIAFEAFPRMLSGTLFFTFLGFL